MMRRRGWPVIRCVVLLAVAGKRLTALCAQDPVTIMVQLPNYPDNPKWKCDGQKLPLENVPLNSSVGTLRDRIQVSRCHSLISNAESVGQAKTSIPIGRQQIKLNDRILTNSHSLASLNFDDGETVTLAIKETKKK
jgi:splicing factor 3A subunit 1